MSSYHPKTPLQRYIQVSLYFLLFFSFHIGWHGRLRQAYFEVLSSFPPPFPSLPSSPRSFLAPDGFPQNSFIFVHSVAASSTFKKQKNTDAPALGGKLTETKSSPEVQDGAAYPGSQTFRGDDISLWHRQVSTHQWVKKKRTRKKKSLWGSASP